eukprot:CAMPEP_0117666656 /NCGR_PEP_ID=MMETSP0804-20121206/10503_1 /TAXON_ID=1074897 /ORGANISM="Tetraselmis astigmatica, Strain CCMP880" /LENGTH=74 /DNA_ID=CAMNT_0005474237 /DNA_START=181 /DNA_END=405 /DNA_ORIENTATION=-
MTRPRGATSSWKIGTSLPRYSCRSAPFSEMVTVRMTPPLLPSLDIASEVAVIMNFSASSRVIPSLYSESMKPQM